MAVSRERGAGGRGARGPGARLRAGPGAQAREAVGGGKAPAWRRRLGHGKRHLGAQPIRRRRRQRSVHHAGAMCRGNRVAHCPARTSRSPIARRVRVWQCGRGRRASCAPSEMAARMADEARCADAPRGAGLSRGVGEVICAEGLWARRTGSGSLNARRRGAGGEACGRARVRLSGQRRARRRGVGSAAR